MLITATPPVPQSPPHADPARPALPGRRLARGLAAAIAFAVTVTGLTSWIIGLLAPGWPKTTLLVAEAYLALAVGLVAGLGRGQVARRALAIHRPSRADLRYAFGASGLALAGATVAYLALSLALGGPAAVLHQVVRAGSDASRLSGATAWVIAFILLRVLLLAGVAEELIFRGAIHSWLAGRLPAAGTVAVTTALFALEHAYFPVLLPLVAAYGIAAGATRLRTGSTVPSMVTHILQDTALLAAAVILF